MDGRKRAPSGELSSYARSSFTHDRVAHDVYRKGTGPAVIVITELPGITPRVLGFADRVAAIGCSVVVPDLFGIAGRDPLSGSALARHTYALRSYAHVCISREFTVLALGRSSPVVNWLRALARAEHARCAGPGVGVVGMCFTGGFALAMASSPEVVAPVLSQPFLPAGITESRAAAVDCTSRELEHVAQRCEREGLRVLGLRFHGDRLSPGARFRTLEARLGSAFVAIELDAIHGHPDGPLPFRHSVLTEDLIDEPGEPTRIALERVLDLFREKLLRVA